MKLLIAVTAAAGMMVAVFVDRLCSTQPAPPATGVEMGFWVVTTILLF